MWKSRVRAGWRNERLFLLLLALFALGLRLGYLFVFVGPGYAPEFDAREYSAIAVLSLIHI